MARISLSFVLTALFLAGNSAASVHPGAEVVGFAGVEKRAPEPATVPNVGRVGHAGAPSTSVKRHRRAANGAKRSRDPHKRSEGASVPEPAKRDLNTPSSANGRTTVMLERAHPNFGQLDGIHPHVYLQQHINRGVRRHAKMTGRDLGPDIDAQFEESIRKRWITAYGHDQDLTFRKRDARTGHAAADSVATGNEAITEAPVGENEAAAAGAAGAAQPGAGFSEAALKALEDNSVTTPSAPTGKNSLGLNIESDDVGYFATFQMGTPPKDYKILVDSGSADLWVPSENCKTCGTAHTTLGPKSSSSFVNTGNPFEVTYGSGAVKGLKVQDDLTVAGLKLANHSFGVTTAETQQFGSNQIPFDGLMGLAISTLSEQKVLTPIESLAQQKLVSAAQLGFALESVNNGAAAAKTGEVTFGGVDNTKFNGALTLFKNVNKQGFWEGDMTDVAVNGKSVGLKGRTSILDTGTTLIVAPPKDAAAVHAAIPGAKNDGQNGFVLPCTNKATVSLTFGGKAFNINPVDLAFQPLTKNLKGECASGISAGQVGGATEWLVGDVFLKNVYFATDVENLQIGLAQRNN